MPLPRGLTWGKIWDLNLGCNYFPMTMIVKLNAPLCACVYSDHNEMHYTKFAQLLLNSYLSYAQMLPLLTITIMILFVIFSCITIFNIIKMYKELAILCVCACVLALLSSIDLTFTSFQGCGFKVLKSAKEKHLPTLWKRTVHSVGTRNSETLCSQINHDIWVGTSSVSGPQALQKCKNSLIVSSPGKKMESIKNRNTGKRINKNDNF